MDAFRSRRAPRFHAIAGAARWNANDRSDLHSHTDVHALHRHADPGIRPERRRNPAAPSRSRRNGVLGFAATDCSGCRRRIGKVAAAHLRSKVPAYDFRQTMRGFRTRWAAGADHPPWRPNWESSWKTGRGRGESAQNRCQWSTHPRRAVFARGASPEGPRQLPAESGCLQRGKGKGHEATLAWGAAGRTAKPDDPRAPSRNRPSRTAGPPPLRWSPSLN